MQAYILALGLLSALSHAAERPERPLLNRDEQMSIKDERRRISNRLEKLQPKFDALERRVDQLKRNGWPDGRPVDEQSAEFLNNVDVRNLDTVAEELIGLLNSLDEMSKRLEPRHIEPRPDGTAQATHGSSSGSRREVPGPKRSTGRKARHQTHGLLKPLVGSQDPGAAPGDLRRTGVITALGKMGANAGRREEQAYIQLDHPMAHEHKDIITFFSCYEDPQPDGRAPRKMRRGDRVSFEIVPGRSTDPKKIEQGRVMAGKVKKHGFLSNEERQSPEWIEIFEGTIVNPDDGKSIKLFYEALESSDDEPEQEQFWKSHFGQRYQASLGEFSDVRSMASKSVQRCIRRRDGVFPGTASTAGASSYKASKLGASSRHSSNRSNRSDKSGEESEADEKTAYNRAVKQSVDQAFALEEQARAEAARAAAAAAAEEPARSERSYTYSHRGGEDRSDMWSVAATEGSQRTTRGYNTAGSWQSNDWRADAEIAWTGATTAQKGMGRGNDARTKGRGRSSAPKGAKGAKGDKGRGKGKDGGAKGKPAEEADDEQD